MASAAPSAAARAARSRRLGRASERHPHPGADAARAERGRHGRRPAGLSALGAQVVEDAAGDQRGGSHRIADDLQRLGPLAAVELALRVGCRSWRRWSPRWRASSRADPWRRRRPRPERPPRRSPGQNLEVVGAFRRRLGGRCLHHDHRGRGGRAGGRRDRRSCCGLRLRARRCASRVARARRARRPSPCAGTRGSASPPRWCGRSARSSAPGCRCRSDRWSRCRAPPEARSLCRGGRRGRPSSPPARAALDPCARATGCSREQKASETSARAETGGARRAWPSPVGGHVPHHFSAAFGRAGAATGAGAAGVGAAIGVAGVALAVFLPACASCLCGCRFAGSSICSMAGGEAVSATRSAGIGARVAPAPRRLDGGAGTVAGARGGERAPRPRPGSAWTPALAGPLPRAPRSRPRARRPPRAATVLSRHRGARRRRTRGGATCVAAARRFPRWRRA